MKINWKKAEKAPKGYIQSARLESAIVKAVFIAKKMGYPVMPQYYTRALKLKELWKRSGFLIPETGDPEMPIEILELAEYFIEKAS